MPLFFNPATTGNSRLFIIEGEAAPDHEPEYQVCAHIASVEKSFGESERIEAQSPDQYRKFDVIGEILGAEEDATSQIVSKYALDIVSELYRLGRIGCPADVQAHFGECEDPLDFDSFQKALVMEYVRLTNWSTDDLGTQASGDQAAINEMSDIQIRHLYELVRISLAERGKDVVTNPLNDVIGCNRVTCGACDEYNDGCQNFYAVGDSSPGSPGTAPDLVYTQDGGDTIYAEDINTLTSADNADGVACLKDWVIVISNSANAIEYEDVDDIGTAGGWEETTTGFVAGGEPNDIWSVGTYAFICGDGGYVYGLDNPVTGVEVLDAGVATTEDLNAVKALNKKFAVAVGDNGAIVYTTNRTGWQSIALTLSDGSVITENLTAVALRSKTDWIVGTSSGNMYYTKDGGVEWTLITNVPVTLSDVNDIVYATNSELFAAVTLASDSSGAILRSYNGGYSWIVLPENPGNIPVNTGIEALATCNDPNFVIGVGQNGNDGYFVVGS